MNTRYHDSKKRALLARQRQILRLRAGALAREQELLDAREPDWEDVAANRSAASVLERLSESELAQLHRVQRALARIDAGTYGLCVVCGERIDRNRLRLMPEADRCFGCTNHH